MSAKITPVLFTIDHQTSIMLVNFKTILFLLGTSLTSSHVLRNRMPSRTWNPPPIEPMDTAAGSGDFWPVNTNLFYKPHIMMHPNRLAFPNELHEKSVTPCNTDNLIESVRNSAYGTFITNPLEANKISTASEGTEKSPVPIMIEELPQHSPIREIIEHRNPLEIPYAPELPALHMPELPAATPRVIASSTEHEEHKISYISDFKPIDIPKVPELPPFTSPEIPTFIQEVPCPNPAESNPFPEFKPVEIPELPQISPIIASDISNPIEMKSDHTYEYVPFIPLRPHGTYINNPLAINEIRTASVGTEKSPIPIMIEELPQHSPIREIIEHRKIPNAPELPPFHMPEMPAATPMVVAPSTAHEEHKLPYISEFKPIDIPKFPVFPAFTMPEVPTFFQEVPCSNAEETKRFPEFKSVDISDLPQVAPIIASDVSNVTEIKSDPTYENAPFIPIRPENAESKVIQIPIAPVLPPFALSELPIPTPVEIIPSQSITPPKQHEKLEIVPEFRPQNTPFIPELLPLYLPKPTFISSYSPMESKIYPEFKTINELPPLPLTDSLSPIEIKVIPSYNSVNPLAEFPPEYKPINLPAPPELPSLYMPELPAPIKATSNVIEDSSTPDFRPVKVNIPVAPELPPLTLSEKPAAVDIPEETSTLEMKPLNIPTAPQLPPLATESISVQSYVPELPEKDTKSSLISQAPLISELPIITPSVPHIEEKSVQFTKYHSLPSLPELFPFVEHKMEHIIVKGPANSNSEGSFKKDERIEPMLISQPLQHSMMYPVFLAKNIIIDRVVPNIYLSHKPYMDNPDSASNSHPVFFNGNFQEKCN